MGTFQVALLPVIAVIVWSFIFGMFWYSPKVLGNVWMKELKITPSKEMTKPMLVELLGSAIAAYLLSVLVSWFQPANITQALVFGIILWACTMLPMSLSRIAWEGSSCKGVMVNIVGSLIHLAGATVIIFHLI